MIFLIIDDFSYSFSDSLIMTIPGGSISQENVRQLRGFLEKVFTERCGQDLKLEIQIKEEEEFFRDRQIPA